MPAWDEAAVATAARRLRLGVDPRRRRQGQGLRLGAGPGASLEFHDHRPYAPGDDLRHLDWSAYARSGQLMLRRHRKEVAPRVEILLDASASMAITPAKAALAATVAGLLATLAEADGAPPALFAASDAFLRLAPPWRPRLSGLGNAGAAGLGAQPVPPLAAGGERILVGDGLCREGPEPLARRLGRDAGSLCLVQVVTRAELDPQPVGGAELRDVEGGTADLVVDEGVCAAYRERLGRLQSAWSAVLAGRGCGRITVIAEDGFDAAVRALLRAGLVGPR
jgi:uncharacterized protein (DUF58 family)